MATSEYRENSTMSLGKGTLQGGFGQKPDAPLLLRMLSSGDSVGGSSSSTSDPSAHLSAFPKTDRAVVAQTGTSVILLEHGVDVLVAPQVDAGDPAETWQTFRWVSVSRVFFEVLGNHVAHNYKETSDETPACESLVARKGKPPSNETSVSSMTVVRFCTELCSVIFVREAINPAVSN
ncbi:hypothetical protein ANO11243_026840 [Dothideomycetidae sp. 11243]|nr:hypothetical protein ANO11243_026840 [fungal sp. No.11243]